MEISIDNAPFYYFATDEEGMLIEVNETLCEALNYGKEELPGKNIEFIFPVATRIFYQTHLSPLLKLQENASEIFISLKKKDNSQLAILCNARRNRINGKLLNQYAGILVKNRKKFEDELIEARKIAEAALHENTALNAAKKELENNIEQLDMHLNVIKRQNHELNQFNHVVTHVLQEPIRKISVFGGILADLSKDIASKEKVYIDKLLRSADQVASVVKGLQLYAWIAGNNAAKFLEVNLNDIIILSKEKVQKEFPDSPLQIIVQVLPVIKADAAQMELLFYQLLSNAVKFRKKDSPAIVHIDGVIIQQNQFQDTPGKYKFTDYLKISIRDEGIGFDPSHKEKIFELFYKPDNQTGNGLGLSLCKKIAENHRGAIHADSRVAIETIITLFLPVNNTSQPD